MSFWEILFNVVAILWSPAGISVYMLILGLFLFTTLFDPTEDWDGWEVFCLTLGWLIVSALMWSFTIWWYSNGFNGFGWHYPIVMIM